MPTSVLSNLSGNWSAKKDPGKLSHEQARPWSHASSTSASSDASGDESGIDEKDTGIDEGVEEYNSGIDEKDRGVDEGIEEKDNKQDNRIGDINLTQQDGTSPERTYVLVRDLDGGQPKLVPEKTEAEKREEYREKVLNHRKKWEDKLISFLKNCDMARIFNEREALDDQSQMDGETFRTFVFLDLFFHEVGYVEEARKPKTSRSVTQMFGEWLGYIACSLALLGQYKAVLVEQTLEGYVTDRVADLGFDEAQLNEIAQYQKQCMIRQLSLATTLNQKEIQKTSDDTANCFKSKVHNSRKLGLYHNSKHYLSNIVLSSLFHSDEARTPHGKVENKEEQAEYYDTQMRRIINGQPVQKPGEYMLNHGTKLSP